jgi:hypothetical protein
MTTPPYPFALSLSKGVARALRQAQGERSQDGFAMHGFP